MDISAAQRMQKTRMGARRRAANQAAVAICTLEFGDKAVQGLEEDLFDSRLSLSDLEELTTVVVDHARGAQPSKSSSSSASPRPVPIVGRRGAGLWKLNLAPHHLHACVRHQVFGLRKKYNLVPGNLLLLQQKKTRDVDPHARISHVLEFTHMEDDSAGESQKLWGEHYPILLRGKVMPVAQPFSLEDLSLSKPYSAPGMMNHERIADEDEATVLEAIGPLP